MTIENKKIIYNLLKTASDNFFNFSSPDFLENPVFTDDYTENEQISDQKTYNAISLEKISQKVSNCSRCRLAQTRKNTVIGMGVEHPAVLVIGEGPGEEEDNQGLPFVGPAGKLLDKMLSAIQLDRNVNCYIANIVKCRPPHNRTPYPDEAECCRAFLDAQIFILKPKLILCAGRTAIQNLLHIETSLSQIRGKFLEYNNIPVLATYHPSALLRDVNYKRPTWEDLKLFKSKLEEIIPDYAKDFLNRG